MIVTVVQAGDWWKTIGFRKYVLSLGVGLLFAAATFALAYAVEAEYFSVAVIPFKCKFSFRVLFEWRNNEIHRNGIFLMCIGFNIINVIMERGSLSRLIYQNLKL